MSFCGDRYKFVRFVMLNEEMGGGGRRWGERDEERGGQGKRL